MSGSVYKEAKKFVERAKKLEEKDKTDRANKLYSKALKYESSQCYVNFTVPWYYREYATASKKHYHRSKQVSVLGWGAQTTCTL